MGKVPYDVLRHLEAWAGVGAVVDYSMVSCGRGCCSHVKIQTRPKHPVPLFFGFGPNQREAISFVVLTPHTYLQERFLRNAVVSALSALGSQMRRGGAIVGLDDVGSIIIDLIREGRCLLTNTYQVRPYMSNRAVVCAPYACIVFSLQRS